MKNLTEKAHQFNYLWDQLEKEKAINKKLLDACKNAVELVTWCELYHQKTQNGDAVLNQIKEAIQEAEPKN